MRPVSPWRYCNLGRWSSMTVSPSILAALVLLSGVPSFGQLQKLALKSPGPYLPIPPQSVEIPAGKLLEVVSTSAYNTTPTFKVDGFRVTVSLLQVPGPAIFSVEIGDQTPPPESSVFVSYRLRDNGPSDSPSSPFSGSAVVIPEDASGPVQIILESSTDLLNWTAANPGTYGSSTEKRFFRVRAVIESGNPAP
jgi:hypothetical protein